MYTHTVCRCNYHVTPLYRYTKMNDFCKFSFSFTGQDYGHQTLNPSNKCQWCDLYDATARANSAWSNRPTVPCDDTNKCTKQDTCKAGRYMSLPCVFQFIECTVMAMIILSSVHSQSNCLLKLHIFYL